MGSGHYRESLTILARENLNEALAACRNPKGHLVLFVFLFEVFNELLPWAA